MLKFELRKIAKTRNRRPGYDCAIIITQNHAAFVIDIGFWKKESLKLALLDSAIGQINLMLQRKDD